VQVVTAQKQGSNCMGTAACRARFLQDAKKQLVAQKAKERQAELAAHHAAKVFLDGMSESAWVRYPHGRSCALVVLVLGGRLTT
jgi:hypothetical protein